MSPRNISTLLLLLVLTGALGAAASVQNPALERGFKPEKAFEIGTVDHVNLFNGNVTVTLPIGQTYAGNGSLSYSLTLVYNGKLWDWQDRCVINEGYFPWAHPSVDSNAGLGWQLSLGKLIPPSPAAGFRNATRFWLYVGADGGEHVFYSTLHGDDNPPPGVFYTRDGTYLRLVDLGAGRHRLDFPDGTKHFFDGLNRLEKVEDPFGNALTVAYQSNRWVLDDSIRQHTVHFTTENFDGEFRPVVSKVDVAVFGGQVASYDFTYGQHTVERPVGHDERNASKWASVPLLEKVRLPDGTYYCMTQNGGAGCAGVQGAYQTTRDGQGWNPGVLKKLRLPTRGQLQWTYGAYEFPTTAVPDGSTTRPAPEFLRFAAGVVERKLVQADNVVHGRWTYDSQITFPGTQDQPVEMTTEVFDPLNHRTLHYFSAYPGGGSPADPAADWRFFGFPFTVLSDDGAANPRYLSQQIFDGTGTDNRKIFVRYQFDDNGFIETGNKNHYNQRQSSRRLRFADASKYRIEDYGNFDSLGNYRTRTISGEVPVGSGTRTEYTAFNCSGSCSNAIPGPGAPWILGTYDHRTWSEGASTDRQDFCFAAATGALLGERIREGSGVGTDDVVRIYEVDGAGNRTSEKHYGGDLANAPTGGICSSGAAPEYRIDHTYSHGQRASTRFRNATHYAVRLAIDRNTGFASRSWDVADVFTDYTYDELGRLTRADPQAGHDGRVDYSYCAVNDPCSFGGSASVKIVHKRNRSDFILAQQTLVFDDFGRLRRHRRKMPDGSWAEQTTNFNALGWMKRRSTWKNEHATPYYTRYQQYDPYGRPKHVESPDGKVVDFFYAGDYRVGRTVKIGDRRNGDGTIGETAHTFGQSFDFMGRLSQADEDAQTGHLETFYEYDVAGRLKEARSRLRGSASGPWQVRTFTYDRRGFLTREDHPEYGLYKLGDYDSLGNPGWKAHYASSTVPAGTDLKFEYDAYGRLLRVRDRADAFQPKLQEFFYATSNIGTNRTKGKIEKAVRHNFIRHPATGAPLQLPATEDFVYSGRGGRLSSRDTEFNGVRFTQEWLYDDLGNVSRWTYPQCVEGPCAGLPVAPRVIEPDYTQGQLVAVPGYASSITYHPNGLVASVSHTNGVTDFIDVAATGMARPSNIRVTTPAGSSELGLHKYDGAGNLVRRQVVGCSSEECDNYYFYDGSGRLTYFHTSSGNWQSYGYDVWGNLELIREFDGQQQLPDRDLPASSVNNRLTGAAYQYDVMGRLTHRDGHVFEYDPLDMVVSHDFPDETYVYTADNERFVQNVFRSLDDQDTYYTIRDLDGRPLSRFVQRQRPSAFSPKADETWAVEREYVYRGTLLLAAETDDTGVKHFSLDHLGTPTLITDAAGAGFAHFYYGFGQQLDPNVDPERLRFTGHERDFHGAAADDLDYMHARFYSPHLSRFLSVDPVDSSDVEVPQSWNKYSYALNNPLKFVDPNGESAVDAVHDATRGFWVQKGVPAAVSITAGVVGVVASAPAAAAIGIGYVLLDFADGAYLHVNGERFGASLVEGAEVSSDEIYSPGAFQRKRIADVQSRIRNLNRALSITLAAEADRAGKATPGQKNLVTRAIFGGDWAYGRFLAGGSSSDIRERLRELNALLARLQRALEKAAQRNSPR